MRHGALRHTGVCSTARRTRNAYLGITRSARQSHCGRYIRRHYRYEQLYDRDLLRLRIFIFRQICARTERGRRCDLPRLGCRKLHTRYARALRLGAERGKSARRGDRGRRILALRRRGKRAIRKRDTARRRTGCKTAEPIPPPKAYSTAARIRYGG